MAGETSVSGLSLEEKRRLCGVPLPIGELEAAAALTPTDALPEATWSDFDYPPTLDWRAHAGQDWTTPIRNQGECNSCSAFGAVGAIESRLEIAANNASLNPNLAEAHLFFCGCSACCGGGWANGAALEFALDPGIVDESCFPYVDHNVACTPCADWQSRRTQLVRAYVITNDEQAKRAIASTGPVLASMVIYDDFFSYQSGVYHHTWGDIIGGHGIALIGYNDVEEYWIAKNSWGTGWGEAGWFRIAYGENIWASHVPLVGCGDLHEPNDTPETARIPPFDVPLTADLCPNGDVDYFLFDGRADEVLLAEIRAQDLGTTIDLVLELYAADGVTLLASNRDDNGGDPRLEYVLPGDGHYYILVRNQRPDDYPPESEAVYELTLDLVDWTTEFAGTPARIGSDVASQMLAIDSYGFPHLVYGGNGLYHDWYDGVVWQHEMIDSQTGVGAFASITLNAQDTIHVSYYDAQAGDLRYAVKDGSAWRISVVDSSGDVGRHSAIAVDAAGATHIVYLDAGQHALKYALLENDTWEIVAIEFGVPPSAHVSAASSNDGVAHVIYGYRTDGGSYTMHYAVRQQATWRVETLPVGEGYNPTLVLDDSGAAHVSFGKSNGLGYIYHNGVAWVEEETGAPYGTPFPTSIALDSDSQPHISHLHDVSYYTGNLIHTYRDQNGWHSETVDGPAANGRIYGFFGRHTSIGIDPLDEIHIGYYVDYSFPNELKVAHHADGIWSTQTVAIDEFVMDHSVSMALDSQNLPHLSVGASDGGGALYLNLAHDGWHLVRVPDDSCGNVRHASLALDSNDRPHIVYECGDALHLAVHDDNDWQIETVITTGWSEIFPDITFDQFDLLHVCFYDGVNQDLKYGVLGRYGWQFRVIDYEGSVGRYCSIAVDGAGQVNIAYHDLTANVVKHVQLFDSGHSSSVIGSGGYGGTSLALDATGTPSVAYVSGNMLMFARATSPGNWQTEVVDCSTSYSHLGGTISLALGDQNQPHISYLHPDGIRYAERLSQGWRIQSIGDASLSGNSSALQLSEAGQPHIVFLSNQHVPILAVYRGITAPAPPSVAIRRAGDDIELNWQDAAVNLFYEVYRSAIPNFTPDESTRLTTLSAGSTSYGDGGAAADGAPDYFYIVRARAGERFADSNQVGKISHSLDNSGAAYSHLAIPLDRTSIRKASELAAYLGADGVATALRFNPATQAFRIFLPPHAGDDFVIQRGEDIFVLLHADGPNRATFVGNVLATYHRLTPGGYTFISLPLQKHALDSASQIAADMGVGAADTLLAWNRVTQAFRIFLPPDTGDDFAMTAGAPFVVQVNPGGPEIWPAAGDETE